MPPTSSSSPATEKPDDRPFLERLPPEMVEGVRLPLHYRLMEVTPTSENRLPQRVAESVTDRAKVFTCIPFYKSITRCVGG